MTPLQVAGYLAHAKSKSYIKSVNSAKISVMSNPDYAVSISWGKDSIVLLHLAMSCLTKSITAVHARFSKNEELPDIPIVRDKFLDKYGDRINYIEVPVWGDWEVYERSGRFFLTPETKQDRKLISQWHLNLVSSVDNAIVNSGCNGKMLGLAAHESRGRKMNIIRRGNHYSTKFESIPKLFPMAYWSSKDVLAYMFEHDLPRLRIYDKSDDPERARSEFAFAVIRSGADAIRRHGAWDEWKRIYPELWAIWEKRWKIN